MTSYDDDRSTLPFHPNSSPPAPEQTPEELDGAFAVEPLSWAPVIHSESGHGSDVESHSDDANPTEQSPPGSDAP